MRDPSINADPWNGIDQPPSVMMSRCAPDGIRITALDDPSKIHYIDTISDITDNSEIVGDKDVGEVSLTL